MAYEYVVRLIFTAKTVKFDSLSHRIFSHTPPPSR
jgi:hypothetical protein